MTSIPPTKEQRLLREFVTAEKDLATNIEDFVQADIAFDRWPCLATRRPRNRLLHRYWQRLHRRNSTGFRLLACRAARGLV